MFTFQICYSRVNHQQGCHTRESGGDRVLKGAQNKKAPLMLDFWLLFGESALPQTKLTMGLT